MELSVHDNILYEFSMFPSTTPRRYTIVLFTEYPVETSPEYTDVIFEDVLAHYFTRDTPDSILFDIRENYETIATIIDSHAKLFQTTKTQCWPVAYSDRDDLLAQVAAARVNTYTIMPTMGLDGWVWATSMRVASRKNRKVFSD